MWVDHVPLAEAMETLSVNVGGRPNGAENRGGDRPSRDGNTPGGNPPPGAPGAPGVAAAPAPADASNTNAPAATPPPAPGGTAGNGPGGPPGGGGPGGPGGGRSVVLAVAAPVAVAGASWNLAFFVAPTSAQVKAEIQAFESGTTDDDMKVYTYPTPLQFVASDADMPASDPRLQKWPGYIPPVPDANPTPAPDGSAPGRTRRANNA